MDRVKKLIETMRNLTESRFTGYVKINFTQGSLGRVEKCEELEDDVLTPENGRRNGNGGGLEEREKV